MCMVHLNDIDETNDILAEDTKDRGVPAELDLGEAEVHLPQQHRGPPWHPVPWLRAERPGGLQEH